MPFIILTQARSGSYHLASLLDSAADVTCYGEIFKANALELPKPVLAKLGLTNRDMALRDADGMALLNHLRHDVEAEGKIFGFKDFTFNLQRAKIFGKIAHAQSWKKVVLLRNLAERYISRIRASDTGVFVLTKDQQIAADLLHKPVRFDPESFEAMRAQHDRFVEITESLHEKQGAASVFFADYSRLSDPAHLQQIIDFIGSDARAETLRSDRVKQFERPLCEGVENWPDFVAYLRANQLGHLLP